MSTAILEMSDFSNKVVCVAINRRMVRPLPFFAKGKSSQLCPAFFFFLSLLQYSHKSSLLGTVEAQMRAHSRESGFSLNLCILKPHSEKKKKKKTQENP